jgi:hypothetical protein
MFDHGTPHTTRRGRGGLAFAALAAFALTAAGLTVGLRAAEPGAPAEAPARPAAAATAPAERAGNAASAAAVAEEVTAPRNTSTSASTGCTST